MFWSRLKNNKCPKCNAVLNKISQAEGYAYGCSEMKCDFSIGGDKFNKIVNDLYKPKSARQSQDNFEALQNFGRKEVTEDFSDSPYL